MIADLLTEYGLMVGHLTTYAPLFILGFFFYKPERFAHVLILLSFTLVYNLWLKSLWQMPLPASVGHDGWAYPSGHMHGSVVFWGWLALCAQSKWFKGLVCGLLSLHGFALVHAGFHYPIDILASLCFGTITLLIYQHCLSYQTFKENPALLGIGLSVLSLILLQWIPSEATKAYLWQAQGLLTGFSLGWLYLIQSKTPMSAPLKTQLVQCLISLTAAFVILVLFINSPSLTYSQVFVQMFFMGLFCALGKKWFMRTKQMART